MRRKIFYPSVITIALLVGNLALRAETNPSSQTDTQGSSATGVYNGAVSSSAPLGFNPGGGPDAADTKKPFTVTATLREEYDDNIFTSKSNKTGSFKTDFSPSLLLDYPMDASDFSARYTFGATYFENRPGDQFDFTHEGVLRYTHSFSERFNLDLREKIGYYTEPNVVDGTGTLQRDGAYISNIASAQFSAQWTPLFGTVTTFTNSIINYQDHGVSTEQNNMENTGQQDFRFAIQPTYTLVFGGIVDNTTYDSINRGYTSYTGNAGLDWQALPTLSFGGRVGGTYTTTDSAHDQVSPYASLTMAWNLGQRSIWTFDYSHSIVPTDVFLANGQIADRISTTFRYNITPNIGTHLTGGFTHSDYTSNLITTNTIRSFTENVLGIDTGATYHFNRHFDFDVGYIFSNVSTDLVFREYTRNQVYLGVRGTY